MNTYPLHGFIFWSAEERQQVAESHGLWPKFLEYWERRQGSPATMDDNGCRERFEYFVEGAYREFMAESEEARNRRGSMTPRPLRSDAPNITNS